MRTEELPMPNHILDTYREYCAEKNSDNCRPKVLEQLKIKLFSYITPENINDVINEQLGNALLHQAIFDELIDIVLELLNNNASIDVRNKRNITPMRLAIEISFPDGIKQLYNRGANVDDIDVNGCTALYWAVRGGDYDSVSLLLGLNANVHAINNVGETILDSALKLMQTNLVTEQIKLKILRLLFENYIGIGTDFDGFKIPPGVADGMPVICATKGDELITNTTVGFEKSICSFEKLLQSKMLNFKKLQYLLEKVFKPYFPGAEHHLYKYHLIILAEHGMLRKNNFEQAGPELETLYKTLRNRTAGLSSLRELATATLLTQHGLRVIKQQPIKLNPAEAQQLSKNVVRDQPALTVEQMNVVADASELLLQHGIHRETAQPNVDTSLNPSEPQKLPEDIVSSQPALTAEQIQLVADARLDPEKLNSLPEELISYIEKLGEDIELKLGHRRTTNKVQ